MASRPRLLASLVLFFLSLVHAQISIEEALSIYLTLNTSLTDCEQCSVCANCFSCSVPGLDTTGTPTCAAQGNDINNATSFWECACHNQPEAEQQLIGLVASSCTKNTTALTNVLVGLCISFEEDIASTTSSGPPSTATSNSTTGNTNCGPQTITIEDPTTLESISNCTTIYGNLAIYDWNNAADAHWTSIDLPPTLHTIYGGLMLGCYDGNGLATTISAPGLTSIGTGANTSGDVFPSWGVDETAYRSLYVVDFPYLDNLSFPLLKTLGGNVVIALNRYLLNIDFPDLADVTGDIYIHGNYTSLSIANLQSYGGNMNVQSSSDLFTCPANFQPSTVKDTQYICKGGVRNLTDAGGRSAGSQFRAPGMAFYFGTVFATFLGYSIWNIAES